MKTPAPYPADTRAKGWRFELDYEQIEQSSTWAVAKPAARPWLLMMWMLAWKQVPCGSWPADEEVIAGALGIDEDQWALHRKALMRGWVEANDGRLYHPTITKRVIEMMSKRRSDSDRQAAKRAREALESSVTSVEVTTESRVTPVGVGCESSTDHRPPITSSLPLVEKKARKRAAAPPESVSPDLLVAAGFDGDTAAEFIAHKARLDAPLTVRAWADHQREALKAGWSPQQAAEKVMAKSWKGFEAKYVSSEPAPMNGSGAHAKTFRERDEERAAEKFHAMTGGILRRPEDQKGVTDVPSLTVG